MLMHTVTELPFEYLGSKSLPELHSQYFKQGKEQWYGVESTDFRLNEEVAAYFEDLDADILDVCLSLPTTCKTMKRKLEDEFAGFFNHGEEKKLDAFDELFLKEPGMSIDKVTPDTTPEKDDTSPKHLVGHQLPRLNTGSVALPLPTFEAGQPKRRKLTPVASGSVADVKSNLTMQVSSNAVSKAEKTAGASCIEMVPQFVTAELGTTTGEGRFTTSELLCCLLFGYTESLRPNSYATIHFLMGKKRSRGSIRRKIEKIVLKDTGFNGGLLGREKDKQQIVLDALWNRFLKLARESEESDNLQLRTFAKNLREFAVTHCKK